MRFPSLSLFIVRVEAKEYEGIPRRIVQAMYSKAVQLRFTRPTAGDPIETTGTNLDAEVVSAILEGTLRLLPRSVSLVEDALRLEKERKGTQKAHETEGVFASLAS